MNRDWKGRLKRVVGETERKTGGVNPWSRAWQLGDFRDDLWVLRRQSHWAPLKRELPIWNLKAPKLLFLEWAMLNCTIWKLKVGVKELCWCWGWRGAPEQQHSLHWEKKLIKGCVEVGMCCLPWALHGGAGSCGVRSFLSDPGDEWGAISLGGRKELPTSLTSQRLHHGKPQQNLTLGEWD